MVEYRTNCGVLTIPSGWLERAHETNEYPMINTLTYQSNICAIWRRLCWTTSYRSDLVAVVPDKVIHIAGFWYTVLFFYIQHHVSKLSDRYIYRYDDMHQSRSVLKTMFKTHVKRVIFFNFCKRKDVLVMSLENSVQQTFLGIESIEVRASNLQFMNMTTTITFHHEKLFWSYAWYTSAS